MTLETAIDIEAAPESVWAALTDVESWPKWTPSMTFVQRLDGGELALGSQARIHQPRLPELVWTVTALQPGRSFTWQAQSAGVKTAGDHEVAAPGGGRVRLIVSIRQTGPLAALVGLLTARQTRRYLSLEAAGFKRCCEQAAAAAA